MTDLSPHCEMDKHEDRHARQDAEIKERLSHIRRKILVMSGKGGVGKSSIAAYLALSLARRGHRVGLMDADLHGPSIPRLLGLNGGPKPGLEFGKALPVSFSDRLQVMSIESLLGEDKDVATIWRGPIKIGVLRQFISDIEWMDLDFMVIDSPPGTGDEPLTVAQTIPDAKALIVTTPQEISLADVRKSIHFCRQVGMQILGIVENMSGLTCPHCGGQIDLFKTRGGARTAAEEHLRLLASLPIEPEVVRRGDAGNLASLGNENLPFTRAFERLVDEVLTLETRAGHGPGQSQQEEVMEMDKMEKLVFAVPMSSGKLCSHFGHCEEFALIETEKGEIRGATKHTPPPHEPGLLPRWLHEKGANIVIAGGMGARAQDLFRENGIQVITGAPQDAPESLVKQYLSNALVTGENVCDH